MKKIFALSLALTLVFENFASAGGVSPSQGFAHQIEVTIGDIQNKLAGPYADVITLAVRTVE